MFWFTLYTQASDVGEKPLSHSCVIWGSHGGEYKRWQPSGILRRAVSLNQTEISEVLTATIIRAETFVYFKTLHGAMSQTVIIFSCDFLVWWSTKKYTQLLKYKVSCGLRWYFYNKYPVILTELIWTNRKQKGTYHQHYSSNCFVFIPVE
jgi:hypothetical protein